jgi:hypothetical protein
MAPYDVASNIRPALDAGARQEAERLGAENKRLERQKLELVAAFKKQVRDYICVRAFSAKPHGLLMEHRCTRTQLPHAPLWVPSVTSQHTHTPLIPRSLLSIN